MKNKLSIIIIICFSSLQLLAQPNKGSFELGGFGNFSKGKSDFGEKTSTYTLNTSLSHYIFNHLSVGMKIYYRGYKEYNSISEPILDEFTIGPILDAYIINKKKIGLSVKSGLNFTLNSDFAGQSNGYSSFVIGPKVAWNITPNLSTSLWFAYRDTDNSDDYTQVGSIIPSDNFDVRWGFSYYLHQKRDKD